MFICILPKKYTSLSIGDKIRYTFGRYTPDVIEINTQDMHYCIIELIEKKGNINFDYILNIAPRFSKNIVVPKDIILPDSLGLSSHVPKKLNKALCLNSIIDILENTKIPFIRRVIGIVDKDGMYTDYVEKMIKYFPTVKVYTENLDIYGMITEKMMDLYGAALLVDDTPEFLNNCNIVLSPETVDQFIYSALTFPLIVCPQNISDGNTSQNIFVIGDVDFPQKYINDITELFDPLTFFDAAYTFCHTKDLDNCSIINYTKNSDTFSPKELTKLVENRYQKSMDIIV